MNSLWPKLWSFVSSKRFQARVLSTFLCAIMVVIKPFSRFGGHSAFLAIAIKELVFPPQENLPQQIEATFFNLVGGLTGVSLSSFGKFLGSLAYNRTGDTILTRCIPGLTLVSICFLAGWLKSWLPRLTLASRIACFVSIWLLTFDVGAPQNIHDEAIALIWAIGTAAVTSLFSCMILLRWSSTQFAAELVNALSELRKCLHSSLEVHLADRSGDNTVQSPNYTAPADLLNRSVSLDKLYQQAHFELRVGRLSVKSLKPLITTVEHLRLILSRRLVVPQPASEDEDTEASVVAAFRKPALDLGAVLVQSMRVIEEQVLACYNLPFKTPFSGTKSNVPEFETRLGKAVDLARTHLYKISHHLDIQRKYSVGVKLPMKVLDSCTCMIFLLQMAQEIQFGLRVVREIRISYDDSRPRLWHPRFSLAWLGVSPTMVSMDEGGTFLDVGIPEESLLLSEREALQGIAERTQNAIEDEVYIKHLTHKKNQIRGRSCPTQWFRSLLYSSWNHPKTLMARLRLSRFTRSLERSPHLRHAFKNATGVALLSLPAYLESNAPGRKWFQLCYGQWMVISFVWVLETNTGATIRVGYLRLIGTLVGATYAWVASLFCRSNRYALIGIMTLAELPISWVIMKSTFSPMGTVAAVTLPPILFTPYFQPEEGAHTWRIALFRAGLISLGILGALLANSVLFPRHCRVLFLSHVCQALGLSSRLLINTCRYEETQNDRGNAKRHESTLPYSTAAHKRKTYKLEREMRYHLHQLAVLLKTMNDEVGLIPKPMRCYRRVLNVLHQLSNLLTSLRKVGQEMPMKGIVTAVTPQRRELVSSICISLFASEQVFRARQPLPQFLPSLRTAFMSLEREVEEDLSQSQQGTSESSRMSLIYILAELDLLAELVDTVDELVDLTRQLFGTCAWLDHNAPTPIHTPGMTSVQDESTVVHVAM